MTRDSAAINKSLMALKDCFREAARARELREKREKRAPPPPPPLLRMGRRRRVVEAEAEAAGGARAGWARVEASRAEADGACQH